MSSVFFMTLLAAAETHEAAHPSGLADPKFWVAVAFLIFLGLLGYLGVHRKISAGLDARAEKIRTELDEARTLKEEAQHLLAQHQRKQREAAKDAEAIIDHAREEAAIIEKDVQANIDTMIERRTRLAQDRIAQAEAAALKQVRAAAVDVASQAASDLIAAQLRGGKQKSLVDDAIKSVKNKLH